MDDSALHDFIIYRCVIGSRAQGLDRDDSDTDRRGIYLPPARLHWSLNGVPEQLENPQTQECYWELGKFIRLALKANPTILETLWTPLVERADPVALTLRTHRAIFLSKLAYDSFNGYALTHFRKVEDDFRRSGRVRWKRAMHVIRILQAGVEVITTGELPVRVDARRDELLAIRDGRLSWDEVDSLRLRLHAELEQALVRSPLPERPDHERADAMLVAARAAMAAKETTT